MPLPTKRPPGAKPPSAQGDEVGLEVLGGLEDVGGGVVPEPGAGVDVGIGSVPSSSASTGSDQVEHVDLGCVPGLAILDQLEALACRA